MKRKGGPWREGNVCAAQTDRGSGLGAQDLRAIPAPRCQKDKRPRLQTGKVWGGTFLRRRHTDGRGRPIDVISPRGNARRKHRGAPRTPAGPAGIKPNQTKPNKKQNLCIDYAPNKKIPFYLNHLSPTMVTVFTGKALRLAYLMENFRDDKHRGQVAAEPGEALICELATKEAERH